MHIKCFSNWAAAPLPLIVLRLWLPLRITKQDTFLSLFFQGIHLWRKLFQTVVMALVEQKSTHKFLFDFSNNFW